MRSRAGVTLIETLMVVSLIAMISISLFGTFRNGLKLWDRSHRFGNEEDIVIFLDKVSIELRNSFDFSQIAFKGRTHLISFPTVIHTNVKSRKDNYRKGEYRHQIGKVEYHFDYVKKKLFRRQADYGQAVHLRYSKRQELFSKIKTCDFQYYFSDRTGRPVKTTMVNVLPRAVRISIVFLDYDGNERTLSKMVTIPMGGRIRDEEI